VWNGLIWLKIRTVAGCGEYGNETSGSVTHGGFLEWSRNYQLLKKCPAALS
jgi:hypothetical protein